MTINELFEYYESNKNECNEIRLVKKDTDKTVVFRHYIEYETGFDKWINLDNEYVYKSVQVVVNYDLIGSPKEFKDIEHLKKIIKDRYEKTTSITLYKPCVAKDILFSIHERQGLNNDEYYLISHFNRKVYTIDDIFMFGYKYYEGV